MSLSRKLILTAGILATSAIALSGCSSTGAASTSTSTSAASMSGAPSGQQLVVYTNSGTNGRDVWWTSEAKAAGFNIKVVDLGGGDEVNRLEAEKNHPVADVAFGLNNMYFSQLTSDKLVEPYTPSWSKDVDKSLGDPSAQPAYWPLVEQGIVLNYDKAAYTPAQAPTSWKDLATNSKFKGNYEVPNQAGLGGATTQLVLAGILSQYPDANGSFGVSDKGWALVKTLFANGSPSVTGVDEYKRMADGTIHSGQMYTSGILGLEQKYNIKVQIVTPPIGVPYAIEQVGLVAGSTHQAEAKKFINWMGSGTIQGQFAKKFNASPVNKAAAEQANPDAVALLKGLKHQDIDYKWVSKHMGDWIQKITLEDAK